LYRRRYNDAAEAEGKLPPIAKNEWEKAPEREGHRILRRVYRLRM
jgi:hypothetical protein